MVGMSTITIILVAIGMAILILGAVLAVIKSDMVALLLAILISVILFCVGATIQHHKAKQNNINLVLNGCDCGGEYKYAQAIGHKINTNFLYICDKCGKGLEMDEKIK